MLHQAPFVKASCKTIIKNLINGTINTASLERQGYVYSHVIRYYEFKLSEAYHNLKMYMKYARAWYAEMGYDRKTLALKVADSKYKNAAFVTIDNMDTPVDDVVKMLKPNYLISLIPEYEPEKIYKEFY